MKTFELKVNYGSCGKDLYVIRANNKEEAMKKAEEFILADDPGMDYYLEFRSTLTEIVEDVYLMYSD